jgi:hypothetical protein
MEERELNKKSRKSVGSTHEEENIKFDTIYFKHGTYFC